MLGTAACGNADNSSSAPTEITQQATEIETSEEVTEAEQSDEEKNTPPMDEELPRNEDTAENTETDTIVVYFSATGTTKAVAERIASVTGSDILRLSLLNHTAIQTLTGMMTTAVQLSK